MATADLRREVYFGVGMFVGVLAFGLGTAFVILGLSTGVQGVGPDGYLTATQETLLLAVGGVLAVGGLLGRVFADELLGKRSGLVRRGSAVAFVVGSWLAVFALAPQSTASGPFVSSPTEKVVLFLIAYALLVGGYLIVKRSRQVVGL